MSFDCFFFGREVYKGDIRFFRSYRKLFRMYKYDFIIRDSDVLWSERDIGSSWWLVLFGSILVFYSVDYVLMKSDKIRYIVIYNIDWGEKVVIFELFNLW